MSWCLKLLITSMVLLLSHKITHFSLLRQVSRHYKIRAKHFAVQMFRAYKPRSRPSLIIRAQELWKVEGSVSSLIVLMDDVDVKQRWT